jgi:hypothetical protein
LLHDCDARSGYYPGLDVQLPAPGRTNIQETPPAQATRGGGRVSGFDGRGTGCGLSHHGPRHDPPERLLRASLKIRKRVEEVFALGKNVGPLRKARFVGLAKVKAQTQTVFTLAAYNLTRMATIFGWRGSTA